jgi:uncharacterized protein YutD
VFCVVFIVYFVHHTKHYNDEPHKIERRQTKQTINTTQNTTMMRNKIERRQTKQKINTTQNTTIMSHKIERLLCLSSLYLVDHYCSVLCGVFCLLNKQKKPHKTLQQRATR